MFGHTSSPCLRTVRRWVADIRNETFTLEKAVSSGRPRHIRTPDLTRKLEDLLEKDPRQLGTALTTLNLTRSNLRICCFKWTMLAPIVLHEPRLI